jgi:glyoxylase-like metal-dependent hydrolase (beta-lactamase superfamily II)
VAYLDEAGGMLFTGDTAYVGPVYVCFEGGNPVAFVQSVNRLAALQGVTAICPGHTEIITERGWLSKLAECAEAAVAGQVPGQSHDDFIVGREFRFGDLSVWLP